MIRILSFNILGYNFVNSEDYPRESYNYLSREYRREKILSFLSCAKDLFDIIGLQEVTYDNDGHEYNYIHDILCDLFYCNFVPHEDGHWDSNIRNGNALFFRKSIFSNPVWHNIDLSTGNHCIRCDIIYNQKLLRVMNIHTDSDSSELRGIELFKALSLLENNYSTDIILGDFNTPTTKPIKYLFDKYSYKDAMKENISTFSIIIPEKLCMYEKVGPIDHVIYRNCELVSSYVLSNNMWNIYPLNGQLDILGPQRLNKCLSLYGSDHIPIMVKLNIV
jgi:endonuclease/exonuclease/phosphatase family metal-dependent hydrolase